MAIVICGLGEKLCFSLHCDASCACTVTWLNVRHDTGGMVVTTSLNIMPDVRYTDRGRSEVTSILVLEVTRNLVRR